MYLLIFLIIHINHCIGMRWRCNIRYSTSSLINPCVLINLIELTRFSLHLLVGKKILIGIGGFTCIQMESAILIVVWFSITCGSAVAIRDFRGNSTNLILLEFDHLLLTLFCKLIFQLFFVHFLILRIWILILEVLVLRTLWVYWIIWHEVTIFVWFILWQEFFEIWITYRIILEFYMFQFFDDRKNKSAWYLRKAWNNLLHKVIG